MVNQSTIMNYRAEPAFQDRSRVINEALEKNRQTAFLSHSHKDYELVRRVQAFLRDNGWNVYVDWQDESMPTSTNRETAKKIKDKILKLDWFLFLATQNSMVSRWCPWEIGYADGVKQISRIIVIPTTDQSGKSHGNEYLDLYRRIEIGSTQTKSGYAVFDPRAQKGTFLENILR